jgi:hypothetical protein
LALAHVRSSSTINRILPTLRKCAALVNRDDGSGVIVQRIIGSDPRILTPLQWIFGSMWLSEELPDPPKLPEAIELFGWQIVREIALVVLLHELHCEACAKTTVRPEALDSRALGVLTGAVGLGGGSIAALFANVGDCELACRDALQKNPTGLHLIRDPDERSAAERAAYGFDHGVLGSYILSSVDFPLSICDEVFEHTIPGKPIWVAEQLADDVLAGAAQDRSPESAIWRGLNMSDSRSKRLQTSIRASLDLPYLAFSDSGKLVA